MKKKQVFLLALMMPALFMLCGCGAIQETSISSSGDSVTDLALRPDGEAGQLCENDGLKLPIPLEYDELLITETPQDDTGVQLFSVSEKASVEAAKAAGMDYEGDSISTTEFGPIEPVSGTFDAAGRRRHGLSISGGHRKAFRRRLHLFYGDDRRDQ